MIGSTRRIQDAFARIAECKAELICANGKMVTKALNINLEARERMLQTMNEIHRGDFGLPPCPPVCPPPPPIIDVDVDVNVKEVQT